MNEKKINIKYEVDSSEIDIATKKLERLIQRTKDFQDLQSAWYNLKMAFFKAFYIDKIVIWLNNKLTK